VQLATGFSAELKDRHLAPESIVFQENVFQLRSISRRENGVKTVEVERYRHLLAVHQGKYPMIVGVPLCEL